MIREALHYIVGLGDSKTKIHTAHGISYARSQDGELHSLASPAAMPTPLAFHFFGGLVAYLRENRDTLKTEACAIVIDNPSSARLVGPIEDLFAQRAVYATVNAKQYLPDPFPYGHYLEIEDFVTKAQTHFVDDHDRADMLAVVGNIRGEAAQTVSDDGCTQQVAASAGIVKVANVKVPNPVVLAPYRTFCEIEQPASPFVLRLRSARDGDLPTAALFESGGGEWKRQAVSDAADYLRELLTDADVEVPVLA